VLSLILTFSFWLTHPSTLKFLPKMASSRLTEIWQTHNAQWQRIDELEKNMEEAVMRKRRRIANLLDEMPTFRKSHLRLFVSHKVIKEQAYEIIVEGKLLVGHLDHKRAKEVDDALYGGQVNPDVDPSDRSQYRGGISERESDTPVEPIHFTHLLDQFQAVVYTVWQPTVFESKTPSKRHKGKRHSPANLEDMLQSSLKTTLVWRREATPSHPAIGISPDSHAFILPYTCPESPSPDLKFHSVVVELQLWPRPAGDERLYQPSAALAKALFPQHTNIVPAANRKRARKQDAKEIIPTVNEIFAPSLLTMKELVSAFFHYIQFKNLQDEQSIINCDKTLQALFECERFNFADLQFFLTSKNLIAEATREPSSFTYIVAPENDPVVLSLDMDANVPSLFHYRCRELLRRLKQREFEYTSSRTKARNWLVTGRASEDKVRQLLDDCVTGHGFTKEHIGGWLALARAAPEGSEARQTAQLDAQIAYLLDRAEHHATGAQTAWGVVQACNSAGNNAN